MQRLKSDCVAATAGGSSGSTAWRDTGSSVPLHSRQRLNGRSSPCNR